MHNYKLDITPHLASNLTCLISQNKKSEDKCRLLPPEKGALFVANAGARGDLCEMVARGQEEATRPTTSDRGVSLFPE